ncbi:MULTISPECIES: hypothetical protein [Nostocales]|uniref:Uncharacterized protein n=3 Tax=Nostocales TaxID=1161 RepID=A0A0C1NK74_9CYAN|nr:hypothetical protein [Tolypothrix bouteillei]KAF3887800.1 hypothetical protein DA73_0400021605 [Tolypothrix bouteillei VB521301]
MVAVVVIINILISLILFYVAWRVWLLKQRLANIADILSAAQRSTHAVLHKAPTAIYVGQRNIHNLRQGNQPKQLQIQRVRQIFSLLAFGQKIGHRYFFKLKPITLKKKI